MEEQPNNRNRYLSGYITGVLTVIVAILAAALIMVLVFHKDLNIFGSSDVGDVAVKQNKDVDDSIDDISKKIEYLAGIISTYYLEDIDSEKIVEGIYKGIFESINDPYSEYYTAEEYKELQEMTTGKFGGIGVKVSQDSKKVILVKEVIEDSGASKAGIRKGDVLTAVDGTDITKMDIDDVIDLIKGEEGTNVKITIKRLVDDKEEEIEYDIKRTIVDNVSVYSKMLDDNIGYIYITSYEGNTGEQFREQLEELKNKGMKGLIIDERGNGGGLLTAVTEVADCLMGEGNLVTTKDKDGNVTKEVNTKDEGTILDVPLVLLVDEYSASASEVLAGAIKDRNIGTLVGTKTYGKGIVQSIIKLNDGSAIKITTERYYTPDGNYIHGTGVEPDVEVEFDTEAAKKGTDTQYDKAVEEINKMVEGE